MKFPDVATVAQIDLFDEVIDVRSPTEYAEDHVPGALSCPVLDDAERAEIGTLHKQVSPFDAKRRGAASAEPERLEKVPLLAKQYNTRLIALTMGASGIPVAADERVNIAIETLIPRMLEIDFPIENLIIDPLVLTVCGCQEYCPQLLEAVRTLQYAWDPAPNISVGLSNVSNAVPAENRALINRVYGAMLMGVGLQMMIGNPLDEELKDTIRIIEERDESTSVGRLYLKIADHITNMEEPTIDDVDMSEVPTTC